MWRAVRAARFLASLGLLLSWSSCGDIIFSTSPEVLWTDPADGAKNVATGGSIRVGFSKVMDPSTVTTQTFSIGNGVKGTINYQGTVAEFIPSQSLLFNTTYTASITTGIRDKDGNALKAAYAWSFTTKPPPPSISGFHPDSGNAGTVVTITGANFRPNPTSNSVRFNGVSAKVLDASLTEIRAEVPSGSTTGHISVSTSGGVALSPGQFRVTPPGRLWTSAQSGTLISIAAVVRSGSQFVAVGAMGMILTSSDGLSWTPRASGTANQLNDAAWSGRQTVAVGDGGTVVTSSGGFNWKVQSSGVSESLFGVVWSGEFFVAVGAEGHILMSPDGISWTSSDSEIRHWLYGVASFDTLVVACGYSGTILTSTDGQAWEPQDPGTTAALLSITATPVQLVAVGYSGTILTSGDGVSWTPQQSQTANHLGGIGWGMTPPGILLVAVGTGGTILTSPDGVEWTLQGSPTTSDLNDVAWSGTLFVAVGHNGTVVLSR